MAGPTAAAAESLPPRAMMAFQHSCLLSLLEGEGGDTVCGGQRRVVHFGHTGAAALADAVQSFWAVFMSFVCVAWRLPFLESRVQIELIVSDFPIELCFC